MGTQCIATKTLVQHRLMLLLSLKLKTAMQPKQMEGCKWRKELRTSFLWISLVYTYMENHCPILCITPPHLLQEIIKHGDDCHRQFAMDTLVHTERMRGQRELYYSLPKKSQQEFRIIESANYKESLKGTVVRTEGQGLTGDLAVDEAYTYIGNTWQFYKRLFNRNSIDGKGMSCSATVHYGNNYDNAFWNGQRMVFGDGDGQIFQRFTKCQEVIGHELQHGVTMTSANLSYTNQNGALNEAISDVFGLLVKQYSFNQSSSESNWIVGDGLLMPSIKGEGIRNIKAPGTAYDDPLLGTDPCPANMKHYVHTTSDNGGIHINCTIVSHAFYISAMEMGGNAWEHLGYIWYDAVTKRLKNKTNFREFAAMTLLSAAKIYGNHSLEMKAVNKGWKKVGIL